MDDFLKKALKLFQEKIPINENNIIHIKKNNQGFTNVSYLITNTKKHKFQVRIGCNKINRNNEKLIINAIKNKGNFIYFDKKTGNAIKKWSKGKNPTIKECKSKVFIKKFAKTLEHFQKIKINSKITQMDYYCFEKITNFFGLKKQLKKYHEIIDKYKNLPLVISHNDLSPKNLIWYKNKITFIDYEWGTLNNKYWDVANFLREIKYPIKNLSKILKEYFKWANLNIMYEFLFATTFFAYQWTFFPKINKKILIYRKNTKKLMTKYFNYCNFKIKDN